MFYYTILVPLNLFLLAASTTEDKSHHSSIFLWLPDLLSHCIISSYFSALYPCRFFFLYIINCNLLKLEKHIHEVYRDLKNRKKEKKAKRFAK